jgi:hypothetical protein
MDQGDETTPKQTITGIEMNSSLILLLKLQSPSSKPKPNTNQP